MVLVTYNIGQVNVELFYILPPLPLLALRPLERDLFFFDYVHVGAALVCYALLSSNWKQKEDRWYLSSVNMSSHGLPLMSRLE